MIIYTVDELTQVLGENLCNEKYLTTKIKGKGASHLVETTISIDTMKAFMANPNIFAVVDPEKDIIELMTLDKIDSFIVSEQGHINVNTIGYNFVNAYDVQRIIRLLDSNNKSWQISGKQMPANAPDELIKAGYSLEVDAHGDYIISWTGQEQNIMDNKIVDYFAYLKDHEVVYLNKDESMISTEEIDIANNLITEITKTVKESDNSEI